MKNVRFSEKADIDLLQIARYTIHKFGLKQARIYKGELYDCIRSLAVNPSLGRDASQYSEELKQFSCKSHSIFYMSMANGIFIVRLLNQRRDFDRHL